MANVNLHVLCFLGLSLEDNVPDHSVLSRFRTRLTKAEAWANKFLAMISFCYFDRKQRDIHPYGLLRCKLRHGKLAGKPC
jgi:hypothetical protein